MALYIPLFQSPAEYTTKLPGAITFVRDRSTYLALLVPILTPYVTRYPGSPAGLEVDRVDRQALLVVSFFCVVSWVLRACVSMASMRYTLLALSSTGSYYSSPYAPAGFLNITCLASFTA